MKIAHICLSNWFVDGVGYQENELVRQNLKDGHEVLVIASTETHSVNGKIIYTESGSYLGLEGAKIIRIKYRRFLPEIIMRKLRMNIDLKKHLTTFQPDVIMFHGCCGWELITVANYIDNFPNVLFYVDSHEDKYNSGKNWLSLYFLHRFYYAQILRYVLPYVKKILCYSTESIEFVKKNYSVPIGYLELYPLGGRPVHEPEYSNRRSDFRRKHGISEEKIVFVQAGRQTKSKNLVESLAAFKLTHKYEYILIVAGVIDDSIKNDFYKSLSSDSRILYLGWLDFDELTSLYCGSDVYLQPGTQSVSMQHALCCHCAVILGDMPSHSMYVDQNGWIIGKDGNLVSIFDAVCKSPIIEMQIRSYEFALENLNYQKLAQRILH